MNLPLESDEDDAPTYAPDENQEYTGDNASFMSLEVSPEERDQAELDIVIDELGNDEAASTANFDDLIFNIEEDDDDSSDFF